MRADGPSRHLDASPHAHTEAALCVDRSFVHGCNCPGIGARIPNDLIATFTAKDPRRRLGVAGIDPLADDALDELEQAVAQGFVAVTVSPVCQGFHPAHTRAMQVYAFCSEAGLPVFISHPVPYARAGNLEFAPTSAWDEVAREFPELHLIFSEIGYPTIDETLLLLAKHPRAWGELSGIVSRPWALYQALLDAEATGVIDKIFLGSGFPFMLPADAIKTLYTLPAITRGTSLPPIRRCLLESIINRDVLGGLGISEPLPPAL